MGLRTDSFRDAAAASLNSPSPGVCPPGPQPASPVTASLPISTRPPCDGSGHDPDTPTSHASLSPAFTPGTSAQEGGGLYPQRHKGPGGHWRPSSCHVPLDREVHKHVLAVHTYIYVHYTHTHERHRNLYDCHLQQWDGVTENTHKKSFSILDTVCRTNTREVFQIIKLL